MSGLSPGHYQNEMHDQRTATRPLPTDTKHLCSHTRESLDDMALARATAGMAARLSAVQAPVAAAAPVAARAMLATKAGEVQRPLSPHLTIYRLPLNAMTSIAFRGTGVGMTVGA